MTFEQPKAKILRFNRFWFLLCAVYLYGFFATSAPAAIGVVELMVGGCLLLTFATRELLHQTFGLNPPRKAKESFDGLLPLVFLILLFGGVLWGAAFNGNDIGAVVRDVVPLGTMFLPIFVYGYLVPPEGGVVKQMTIALGTAGVAFAVRHFLSADLGGVDLGSEVIVGEGAFFSNPVVIFAASYFMAAAALSVVEGKYTTFFLNLILGICCMLPLMAVLLRSQIFLVSFGFVCVFLYAQTRRVNMVAIFMLGGFLLVLAIALWDVLLVPLWELLVAKTENAGVLNDRDAEAIAVLEMLNEGIGSLLFGTGWGGVIENPAAGGSVGFTHSFIMYSFFKTGVVGAVLFAYYLSLVAVRVMRLLVSVRSTPSNLPILVAIVNTLLINIFVEAGYKMLTFGVVLALLWAVTSSNQKEPNSVK